MCDKMGNRHIKTINGRKYYYESIRKGKKVTSRYLGPVEQKNTEQEQKVQELQAQLQTIIQNPKVEDIQIPSEKKQKIGDEESEESEFYIG